MEGCVEARTAGGTSSCPMRYACLLRLLLRRRLLPLLRRSRARARSDGWPQGRGGRSPGSQPRPPSSSPRRPPRCTRGAPSHPSPGARCSASSPGVSGRAPGDGVSARPHDTARGAVADLAQGRATTGAAGAAAAGAAGAAAAGARRAAERDGPDRAAGAAWLPAGTGHLGPAPRADDPGRLPTRLSPGRDVPGPGARVATRTSLSSNNIV